MRVYNKMRGLLVVDLPGGQSMHLAFKEERTLTEEQVACRDVQRALAKGYLVSVKVQELPKKAAIVVEKEQDEPVAVEEPVKDDEATSSPSRREKRRKKRDDN